MEAEYRISARTTGTRARRGKSFRRAAGTASATGGAILLAALFLLPLLYGVFTAFKTEKYMFMPGAPAFPSAPREYEYEGSAHPVVEMPTGAGTIKAALVKKGKDGATAIDVDAPEKGPFEWTGKWRTLPPIWEPRLNAGNFAEAWDTIAFARLLFNTLAYALVSMAAMVASSAVVAYGFARFDFPFKGPAFILVLATMILPPSVTLIPTYAFFHRVGLVGTWLPLVLPAFFAHAYNVFLLRQFIMGIPRDMDEAAMIDGASYPAIFLRIVLPQAVPALIAVALFHFFYCWNDFFGPLIYLAGKPELFPISLGLSAFMNMYKEKTTLVQAASLMATAIPFAVFFMFQKVFIHGVVVRSQEK